MCWWITCCLLFSAAARGRDCIRWRRSGWSWWCCWGWIIVWLIFWCWIVLILILIRCIVWCSLIAYFWIDICFRRIIRISGRIRVRDSLKCLWFNRVWLIRCGFKVLWMLFVNICGCLLRVGVRNIWFFWVIICIVWIIVCLFAIIARRMLILLLLFCWWMRSELVFLVWWRLMNMLLLLSFLKSLRVMFLRWCNVILLF